MHFDLDFTRVLIGAASLAIATGSGVAALLVDFRDKSTGNITKWGRFAIAGLSISFVVGTANVALEYVIRGEEARRTADKSRELTERTGAIAEEINRSRNPLRDIRADYLISFPARDLEFASYSARVERTIKLREAQQLRHKKPDFDMNGLLTAIWNSTGVSMVGFEATSPLYPDRDKESSAALILANQTVSINFFKKRADMSTTADRLQLGEPDLRITLGGWSASVDTRYQYYMRSKKVAVFRSGVIPDPNWNSTGQILSIFDLLGARMVIELAGFTGGNPTIEMLTLSIAERRAWQFTKEELKQQRYQSRGGTQDEHVIWTYEFPDSLPALRSELERYRIGDVVED